LGAKVNGYSRYKLVVMGTLQVVKNKEGRKRLRMDAWINK
jgi:hypothetical protein